GAAAGEAEQPERVAQRLRDPWWPIARGDIRPLAAPWVARIVEAAARGLFPLRLGGETMRPVVFRQPLAVAHRLEPVDADHGLLRVGEAAIAPPWRGRRVPGREAARGLQIGVGSPRGPDNVTPHAMPHT